MINFLKIFSLVIIIMISRFVMMIDYNEMVYVPYGYRLFNSNWLVNDWSLSSGVAYLSTFGYPTGFFVHYFGFIPTIFIGRIISYFLFAFAYQKLLKAVKLKFALGAISLMVYLTFFPNGMNVGEWMIGGFESKVFAYSFILLAISAAIRNNIGLSLLYSGISLSFHPLIGSYHCICLASILVYQVVCQEVSVKQIIRKSHLLLVGGFLGFFAILSYLLNQGGAELNSLAWEILVKVRNPFHNLPKLYPQALLFPLVFTMFNIASLFLFKKKEIQSLTFYILSATSISFLGILIFLIGDQSLLRYYLFRLNDAVQPFLTLTIIFVILQNRLADFSTMFINKEIAKKRLLIGILLGLFLFYSVKHRSQISEFSKWSSYNKDEIKRRGSEDLDMMEWIKENTSTNAVFIVPIEMEDFYVTAERALFVSWKYTPLKSTDIIQWYDRMVFINNGQELLSKVDAKREVERNYGKLSEEDFRKIKKEYPDVTHFIFSQESPLNFPEIHRTNQFVLYKL